MDTAVAPDPVERFRADLEAICPEAAGGGFTLGLAVSGGPDSLAMLLLANAACPGRVEAASVDHGLRPESAEEAGFVARLCERMGVPHRILSVRVEAGNIQSKARAARYAALAGWKDARGLDVLVTAHHADDQAETLLMRLNRGSGLPGLVSIRPMGTIPGASGKVIRPLLDWRKHELESVVSDAGIEPVRDPSNEDRAFDRVRIRKTLAELDWLDPLALSASARLLNEANQTIDRLVDDTYSERVEADGAGFTFAVDQTEYVQIEVIRRIFTDMGAKPPRSEIARLVRRLSTSKNASLAGILATQSSGKSSSESQDSALYWHFQPEPQRRTS